MATVTIYDIAREAKVSPATVSRVLTGSARVSPKREKEIRRIINKYGFQPNAMAQSLHDGRTRLIGLITGDIRNPFFAEACYACEVAAKKKGYQIMLRNIFDGTTEKDSLSMFAAHRVEAIIQLGGCTDHITGNAAYVQLIRRAAKPFVSMGKLDGADIYTCSIDYSACMDLAFTYLHRLGHERIALLGGRLSQFSTYDKWTKYIYLLGTHDIPFRPDYVQESGYSFDNGFEGMERLLALDVRPTAVIAITDQVAAGAIAALGSQELRCPQDISIIGQDNTFLSYITSPSLTSIAYNYEKLGEELVSIALKVIAKEDVPRETILTPSLVQRESCAPVKKTFEDVIYN